MFRRYGLVAALVGLVFLPPSADAFRRTGFRLPSHAIAFLHGAAPLTRLSPNVPRLAPHRARAMTMLDRGQRVAKFYVQLSQNKGGALVAPSAAKAGNPKTNSQGFFVNIKDAIEKGGAKLIHFGPQRSNGLTEKVNDLDEETAESLRKKFPDLYIGLKPTLMFDGLNPGSVNEACKEYLMPYIEQGDVDGVYLHPESHSQSAALLAAAIREGCVPGVVVNPSTPVSVVEPLLAGGLLQTRIKLYQSQQLYDFEIDGDGIIVPGVVVIMLVNPGYGGLKYESLAMIKMQQIADMAKKYDVPCPIFEIDGGVSSKNAQKFVDLAARLKARLVFVAGGVFKDGVEKKEFIDELEGLKPSGDAS